MKQRTDTGDQTDREQAEIQKEEKTGQTQEATTQDTRQSGKNMQR